jgi:isoquinoline 1-oxidoreductase subunit alpha
VISALSFSEERVAEIRLTVNGAMQRVDVDPEMPLLWLLRDVLALTGTKYGCGADLCGACSVHLDGERVFSCVTPAKMAEGRSVVTIEGLATEVGRALKQAWADEQVPQCGYCQPGQIMAASALLGHESSPSDESIDRAMRGNLCRCGTYDRIRSAIHRAAEAAACRRSAK